MALGIMYYINLRNNDIINNYQVIGLLLSVKMNYDENEFKRINLICKLKLKEKNGKTTSNNICLDSSK